MNFKNSENIYPIESMPTVIEISKKITELLDQNSYDGKYMFITKEHIKQNLAELIRSGIHYPRKTKEIKYSDRLKHKTSSKF